MHVIISLPCRYWSRSVVIVVMIMCIDACVQFLHKLTARALIRDYEDGSLESNEAEHEVCVIE